jgi:agmatine/peptidylarginine deiminase
MSAQDEVADLLCGTGPYAGSGNQKNSIGGLMYNGSCLMMDEYGSSGEDMFLTWTIFGDASLQVRTDTPSTMTISHNANILVGQTSFNVSTGVEGALACLYDGTDIIGSGFTNASGNVILTLDPAPTSPGNLTLTITAYNKTTSVETIPVIANGGPYVVIDSYTVSSGGDDVIEAGETAYLTVTLLNNGTETATNTSMTLSESDSYITLTDDYESYGSIAASGSITKTNAYTFEVSSSIPDNHTIHFDAVISCDEDSWYSEINLTASNPPDITVNPIQFDETLQPDETSSDNLNIGNTGGATLDYTAQIIETTRSPLLRDMINNSKNIIPGDETLKIPSGIIYPYTSRAYCSASGGCDEYISRIQVGDIDNSSTCSGYADYTSISTDMTIGTGYNFILTIGNPYTYDTGGLWIDWNQDEDFEDAGEEITISWSGTGPYSIMITPPEDALTGQTRMRARLTWNTTPTACETHTYGEVEDYSVNVVSSGPEWVTLDGGSEVSSSIAVGAGDDVIIVGFDSTDLTEGVYTADIVISSNDPDESPITVPVTLTVDSGGIPEPEINISVTELNQELEPDETDSQNFNITNVGDPGTTLTYNITWEYTAARSLEIPQKPDDMPDYEWERLYLNTGFRDETWLDVNPISGDCIYNESDLITADFNSAGMTEGTYSATITISNNAGADQYVYVTLDVEITGGTTPVNPRAIAEFESMEGVLVRYPFGIPVEIIAEMSEDVMVTTIVANAGEETTVTSIYSSNGVNMSNCNFEYSPTDTYWIRDYGPWWIEDGSDDVAITDYTYNRPRPNDNAIPGEMATFLSENLYLMGLEHSGGNYMTDGMGIAVSTDLVWDENNTLSHIEIKQRMGNYLGIQTYHVVADPNGDYIRHVDCWAKFLDVDKLLIREVPASHSQYDEIEATVDYFEAQTSSYGTPYDIYRVYTPNDEPYTNSLILNDKVFVPTMSSSWDDDAIALYESAMPGYEILGFYYSSWQSTDAIHCRLRETANREMLYINHLPISGTVSNRANYEINATIVPYSEQPVYNDSLLVYYKVDSGVYTSIPMVHQSGNNYQGIIPEQAGGSEISYFIHAADQSGQSANHPFIGAFDPHIFNVSSQPGTPVNVQIQVVSENVQLSWDAVTGANSYKVYSSNEPYTGFVEDTSGSFAGESWIAPIGDVKKFYHVTASTETIRSKDLGSQDAYHPDKKLKGYESDKFINRKRK